MLLLLKEYGVLDLEVTCNGLNENVSHRVVQVYLNIFINVRKMHSKRKGIYLTQPYDKSP